MPLPMDDTLDEIVAAVEARLPLRELEHKPPPPRLGEVTGWLLYAVTIAWCVGGAYLASSPSVLPLWQPFKDYALPLATAVALIAGPGAVVLLPLQGRRFFSEPTTGWHLAIRVNMGAGMLLLLATGLLVAARLLTETA